MRYYQARRVSDPVVVGAGSQLVYASDAQNVAALDALDAAFQENWKAGTTTSRTDSIAPIRALLSEEAIATSFAYTSRSLQSCYFAVSDPAKKQFSSLSFRPSVFHPLAVANCGTQYWLFHCPPVRNEAVVFADSLFFNGSPISSAPRAYHQISDDEAYQTFIKRPGGGLLKPEYFEVAPELIGTFDVLNFRVAGALFVSERFVEISNQFKLSGLSFIPAWSDAHPRRIYANPILR